MIKLKKGIRIEILEKYGFEKRYNEKTGKVSYYIHKDLNRKVLAKERIFEASKRTNNSQYAMAVATGATTPMYLPRINFRNYYSTKEMDLLFDLIKDDIVEKIEEGGN